MVKEKNERDRDLRCSRKYGDCPSVFRRTTTIALRRVQTLRKTGSKEPRLEMSRGSLFMNTGGRPMAHGVPSNQKLVIPTNFGRETFGLTSTSLDGNVENSLGRNGFRF